MSWCSVSVKGTTKLNRSKNILYISSANRRAGSKVGSPGIEPEAKQFSAESIIVPSRRYELYSRRNPQISRKPILALLVSE